MAQVFSHLRLISKVRNRAKTCEFLCPQLHCNKLLSKYLCFSPVSIIPPILHINFHLNTVLMRRNSWRIVRIFKQSNSLSETGEHWTDSTFRFYFLIMKLPNVWQSFSWSQFPVMKPTAPATCHWASRCSYRLGITRCFFQTFAGKPAVYNEDFLVFPLLPGNFR